MDATPRTATTPRFRLRTLGTAALERELDGRWEVALRGGKPLALLIYLACVEGRGIPRERLADLLWGDEAPERARASLRQALHTVRRLLPDGVLWADRDEVALVSSLLPVDRDRALHAVRQDALPDLLDAYAGPFCPHLEVGGAAEFERWREVERGHLERVVVDAVVTGLARLIADGEVESAVTGARRLVAAAPESPDAVAVLADALIASGAIPEARERLEAACAARSAGGAAVPTVLQERVDRLRRRDGQRSAPAVGTLEVLGQTLVGREGPLAELLREAERARTGGARRVTLVAPAGMGKTRLLDEFEARMRLRGARVVRVRVLPGMREVAFAAAADLVRALVALPGSLGVSGASARALIAMIPELADRYPAAEGSAGAARAEGDAALLARRDAVADLLGAVAEDRLVLLLMDDLQYADEPSRRLLASLTRPPRARLLEVIASRPGHDLGSLGADHAVAIDALTESDLRTLLTEVATLPDAPWVPIALVELVRRSRGVPQLVLAALRALVDAGELRLQGGRWEAPDAARLPEAIAGVDGVPQVLAALAESERRVLRLLAAWARPLEETELLPLLGADGSAGAILNRLESLGLVRSRDSTWAVAHDSIVDALASSPTPPGEVAPLDVFVAHWAPHPRLTVAELEHLALLCGAQGNLGAARRLVARIAGRRRWREAGLRGPDLARLVARAAGRADWEVPLDAAVGFLARRTDRGLAALGAGAMLAGGTLLWIVAMLQPRLTMETEPIAEASGRGAFMLIVQPRVAVRNGFGRLLDARLPVEVRVPNAVVHGDSAAVTVGGRYQFERLVVERDSTVPSPSTDDWRIEVTGPWYVRPGSVRLRGQGSVDVRNAFRPVGLRVAGGRVVGPMQVRARVGDSLRFDLTFEYTTIEATANYIVAASPTWGDRRTSVIRLAGLPSPVRDAWRTVTFSVEPPPWPGVYHVVIISTLEDRADFIFASTNWTVGQPIWFDGNDVVDLPARDFERLRVVGRLTIPAYLYRGYQGRLPELRIGGRIVSTVVPTAPRIASREVLGTAIRVDVMPR